MEVYVIFYYLAGKYDSVSVKAYSLRSAMSTANALRRKSGAVILGVCPEYLLNSWCCDK